jgi:hypothetical protein
MAWKEKKREILVKAHVHDTIYRVGSLYTATPFQPPLADTAAPPARAVNPTNPLPAAALRPSFGRRKATGKKIVAANRGGRRWRPHHTSSSPPSHSLFPLNAGGLSLRPWQALRLTPRPVSRAPPLQLQAARPPYISHSRKVRSNPLGSLFQLIDGSASLFASDSTRFSVGFDFFLIL